MFTFRAIDAILFDSGDTLVRPVGGEWLPGPVFRRLVTETTRVTPRWDQLARGHEAGMRRLLMNHQLLTEAEEIERYADYCTTVLEALGISPTSLDTRDLARQMVLQVGIEPFDDTLPTLERFKARNLRLAIISNGWPSLDRQLREVGLRHFFDPLIISAHVGSRKPAPRIFEVALELLGTEAGNVLLVDDAVENVAAARAMGMQGVVIARERSPSLDNLPWIRSLSDLDIR